MISVSLLSSPSVEEIVLQQVKEPAGSLRLNNDVLCQGFESLSIFLEDSDGYMAGFAGVDVPYDTGFALMYAADDFTLSAVREFAWLFGFHFFCLLAS